MTRWHDLPLIYSLLQHGSVEVFWLHYLAQLHFLPPILPRLPHALIFVNFLLSA